MSLRVLARVTNMESHQLFILLNKLMIIEIALELVTTIKATLNYLLQLKILLSDMHINKLISFCKLHNFSTLMVNWGFYR